MARFDGRGDDEKAAEKAAEAAQVTARFAEAELAKASAAKARGDGFFEAALGVLDLQGHSSFGKPSASISRRGPNGAVLGEIEALGWRLEHASYVFLETASVSTNRLLVTGEGTAVRGVLTGLYLFRNTGSEA